MNKQQIMSLTVDEIISNLYYIDDLNEIKEILETIKIEDDSQLMQVIEKIHKMNTIGDFTNFEKDEFIIKYALKIKNEDLKLKSLKFLYYDASKMDVAFSMSKDKRLRSLNYIEAPRVSKEIINTIYKDETKIDNLLYIKKDNIKAKIIKSIEDENKRLNQISELKRSKNIADVITSFENDDIKISLIDKFNINKESELIPIITSFNKDENRDLFIDKIKDEKLRLIMKMSYHDNERLMNNFKINKGKHEKLGIDKEMTFGIEIETEGEMSSELIKLKEIIINHDSREVNRWEITDDTSLNKGVEIKSPIMRDIPEFIEEIHLICEMLNVCNQEVNGDCGGHVHIGANSLNSVKDYTNLFELWGNAEKVLYMISNELGTIPRESVIEYAKPNSEMWNDAIENGGINLENEDDLQNFIEEIQEVQNDRGYALNILNVNNFKNTIEFRLSNGTMDPDTWMENIRLFARMVQLAQVVTEIEEKDELDDEEKELISLKNSLKTAKDDAEKLDILLELLFSPEERETYIERYIVSSQLLDEVQEEYNMVNQMKFKKVDFSREQYDEER